MYILFAFICKSVWFPYYPAISSSFAPITVLALIITISIYHYSFITDHLFTVCFLVFLLTLHPIAGNYAFLVELFLYGPFLWCTYCLCVVVFQIVLRYLPVDLYVFVIDLGDIVLLWFVWFLCVFCLWWLVTLSLWWICCRTFHDDYGHCFLLQCQGSTVPIFTLNCYSRPCGNRNIISGSTLVFIIFCLAVY